MNKILHIFRHQSHMMRIAPQWFVLLSLHTMQASLFGHDLREAPLHTVNRT
jgi:hypothetical protein